jgi:hypothetical protein
MTEADIAAIATIVTRMNIFLLFVADFSEVISGDKREGAVKQYNTKDIGYDKK